METISIKFNRADIDRLMSAINTASRHELEKGGARRLLYFLGKIEPMDEWARLDGYGNAVAVSGSDMVEMLKGALQEIEDEQRD